MIFFFIYSKIDDFKIKINGDITISASSTDRTVAIGGPKIITIGGEGTLNIVSFSDATFSLSCDELVVGTNTNLNCNTKNGMLFFGTITNYGTITSFRTEENDTGAITCNNINQYGTIIAGGGKVGILLYNKNFINYGDIIATGTDSGIFIATGTLTNYGTVTSTGNAEGSSGICIQKGNLNNQGEISATGIVAGISIQTTGNITNEGTITAQGGLYGAIYVCGGGITIANNLGIIASTVQNPEPVSIELDKLNANIENGTYKYVKISPKAKEEPKPAPSYHGSTIDYAQYQAILEQAQKQQAELDAKRAEEEKLEKHKELVKEAKAVIKKTEFKATSTKQTKLNGKKAVKIKWEIIGGEYDLSDFDGFDIYRSAKKNSGYTKTPFFTTTKWTYTNNKDLKAGKTYYYKVRAWKMVDGEKVYTGWSTKAWRTVK